MPSKRFYRIQEVSELLCIPTTTLRWWEGVFPMFKPNRTPTGQRRYTIADVKMAERIKELLYVKGLKIGAAVEVMNKAYRTSVPRRLRLCRNSEEAIVLLDEVKAITEDLHAAAKIDSVMNFLNHLRDVEK